VSISCWSSHFRIAAFLAVILALAGCGGKKAPPPAAPPEQPAPAAPSLVAPPVTATPIPATEAPPPAPGVSHVEVGLLLPLSGQAAPLGQAMLEAAQMALYETGNDKLELLVRDSGGNATVAAQAAHSVIDGGAKLILGPLLSSEVEAVKPVAQAANVPLVAFVFASVIVPEKSWAAATPGAAVPSTKAPVNAEAENGPADCGSRTPSTAALGFSRMNRASFVLIT